jgi:ankyrin repeat protein
MEYCDTFGVASINAKDKDGNTPLMRMMLEKGSLEVEYADIIIKLGADVMQTNNQGESTLDIAIRNSSKKIIETIVDIIKKK